ncbi:MAG: DUF3667 domain-containing protein [Cyclobacteriaceae bacterium]
MRVTFFKRKPDIFDYNQERTCKNCGHVYQGRFCNICGQKIVEPAERTVSYFLGHIFNAFTFVDGKFWNSIKSLIVDPGRMSLDIAEGKGNPYMKPVALFFVGNLIYFLIPIYQTFDSNLYSQMDYMLYSDFLSISEVVGHRVEREGISFETFADRYAAKSREISKTSLILVAVFISLFSVVINYTKNKFFSDHILFGLELSSFVILYLTILLGILFWSLGLLLSSFYESTNLIRDDVFFMVSVPILFYFLVRGIKIFYKVSWLISFIKSLASLVALVLSIELYRLFVFTLTMLLI